MQRVYLTQEGYEKMVNELEYCKNTKRREIAKALEHARQLGDLRENAEYDSAKNAQAQNEGKIAELEDKLSRVEIVDESKISTDKVYIGAKAKVLDLDTGQEDLYTLVGPDEANAVEGLISTTSPVGKGLLGHGVGEEVEIEVPAGTLRYRILDISR
ncbi:MAG: transcription elongation factor GreA [Candidatus Omnitrophica bacterium]|nr:transcription elongation factor GreA [Candidatus Omnitrophota bacterium]